MLSVLVIPARWCVHVRQDDRERRQGYAIFSTMMVMFSAR